MISGSSPLDPDQVSELTSDELRQRMSELVYWIEDGTADKRVTAAWGLCQAATEHPKLADEIRHQLRQIATKEADLVRQWLRQQFPQEIQRRGTPRDWRTTDPLVGDKKEPSKTPKDKVVKENRITLEVDQTDIAIEKVMERLNSSSYTRTYVVLIREQNNRQAALLRTYVPPEKTPRKEFKQQCRTAFNGWKQVDDHPHIATVYDYGVSPHPWIVIEYADSSLISAEKTSVVAALETSYRLAKAVAHAHERGIAHTAIDPSQVMVQDDDKELIVGFGIDTVLSSVDNTISTDPRFAAPEYFGEQYGQRDWATDIYHLGTTFYYILTGEIPAIQTKVQTTKQALRSIEPPSSIHEDIPESTDRIVQKALATRKIRRYESADEMCKDIRDAMATVRTDHD